ncbi:Vacuolar protein 8 [Bienertia sinuspersici]
MGEIVKQILTRPVQLADQITKATDEAVQFKPECLELQAKTKKLADLIRQAARCSNDLYERPTRRIIDDTEQVLDKALALVEKCCTRSLIKRVFTIIPNAAFRKMICQLDNSIGDVSWLLRVSTAKNDDDDADIGWRTCRRERWRRDRMRQRRWVSLARDNERYGKLIIEEGGVGPLLKLAKEGKPEGQENAARCIGLLGRDQESVEPIVNAGVCSVFGKMLKDGQMKVQAIVAWAVSELAAHYPKCQDHFAQNNVIRLLVSHLAFETIQEHSRYAIAKRKKMSIHAVVIDSTDHEDEKQAANQMKPSEGPESEPPAHTHVLAGGSIKGREYEDPVIKAEMKAMAARALWHLAKGNVSICRSITESRALLCFAVLLEKGQEEVKYNSAMALMEITSVAEDNTDLRKTAFKPTSPAAKAVVDQLLRVVTEANPDDLLVPCIKSLGNLARTFRATETRIIDPLVKLIDERETEVMLEAVIALLKFACSDNYLHDLHCKSIIKGGGVKFLIQLVYFGEQVVQIPSLILLCYIALHVPDSEALAQEEVIIILEWATKQSHIMQDPQVDDLLPEAKSRLELYQSRGSRF